MSKAWCEAHNSVEPAIIGKDDNYALHNAMGTGPFRQVSREPDRKTVVEKYAAGGTSRSAISIGWSST